MKAVRYQSLVQKRKACRLCPELKNPGQSPLSACDSSEIGPWSRWQQSLSARVMMVGQDWGDVAYYVAHNGVDQRSGNPTNENLAKLLGSIGLDPGSPGEPIPNPDLFFTNLVLCLKTGGLQGPVKSSWFRNCASEIFTDLLEIVDPQVIVTLGLHPTRSILSHFGKKSDAKLPLRDLVAGGPYELPGVEPVLFPMFHCGAWGVNKNRAFKLQLDDWAKLGAWLSSRERLSAK